MHGRSQELTACPHIGSPTATERHHPVLGGFTPLSELTTLLTLPPEIRNYIYSLSLVVSGTINPYPTEHQPPKKEEGDQALPTVALLQTCRKIREETLPILYGQNTWRLNVVSSALDVEDPIDEMHRMIWDSQTPAIPSVITAYSIYDVSCHARSISDIDVCSTPELTKDIVLARMKCDRLLRRMWNVKIGVLKVFVQLKTLLLHFENCYSFGGLPRFQLLQDVLHDLKYSLTPQEGATMPKQCRILVQGLDPEEFLALLGLGTFYPDFDGSSVNGQRSTYSITLWPVLLQFPCYPERADIPLDRPEQTAV
ncbi:MAG: hypothetical protein LQ341_007063 [Variospora aurantia]|nr:MAG: hypothetical protein LQ341_007063 [Variospora aurantia]